MKTIFHLDHSGRDQRPEPQAAWPGSPAQARHSPIGLRKENNPVPELDLNLARAAADMPEMAIALIRAIITAAGKDRDEMTVLLIHGKPAAVIAPYGHERRPGAAAGIRFDQTAPPEARLVLTDVWGGSIRMSTGARTAAGSPGWSWRVGS
jgi:hypothetical protein